VIYGNLSVPQELVHVSILLGHHISFVLLVLTVGFSRATSSLGVHGIICYT